MKYLNRFKVLLIINLVLLMTTIELSPRTKSINVIENNKSSIFSKSATNSALINNAIKDIRASLNNPCGKLSSICCTYKCNGATIITKEKKEYFDNYRKKPTYRKESFLNENIYPTNKIVQVKFNKHSDQISITYKDPNAKGRRIYSESLDASKFQLV